MDTPASLLERLRDPVDAAAWGRFVGLYTPLLFFWARRAGLQDADASDLVQEVLTVLFRKLPGFNYQRDGSFRGWLRTVVVNKWREHRRRKSLSLAPFGDATADIAGPDDFAELEEQEYRRHLVHQALRAIRVEFPATSWTAGSCRLRGRRAGRAGATGPPGSTCFSAARSSSTARAASPATTSSPGPA